MTKSIQPTGPTEASLQGTRRVKWVAGLTVVLCLLGSTLGTVLGMTRQFNALANEDQPISPAEMAESIDTSLAVTIWFMPVVVAAAIVWLVCRQRLSRASLSTEV